MQFLFIISFITLGFVIALANGIPATAEISNKYDKEIKAKIDELVNILVDQQRVTNSEQRLIGLVLSGLLLFLKTFLVPAFIGISNTIPYLQDILTGALNGLASGGLIGSVGGLAKNAAAGFRKIIAKIGVKFFEGSDPVQNAKIFKNINDTLYLGQAKLDAENMCLSDVDANLNYVIDFVGLLLSYVSSFLPYLSTVLGPAIDGLTECLTERIDEDGLLGGVLVSVLGGLKRVPENLATGSIKAFGGFLTNLLS